MSMTLKYFGEFVSRDNVRYRVEIMSNDVSNVAQEIRFPGDEPLVIEWESTDKVTPIQPSIATLQVLSESDRQFIDMYRVEVGAVMMIVKRNGEAYWRGTLDTEIYEEPYAYQRDYIVSLTFSDFGVLGRKKFTGIGCQNLQTIIEGCLIDAQILAEADITNKVIKYVSTTEPICGYTSAGVDDIFGLLANSENFFDEDGEAMSLKEVLVAVLQPFALQIKQKGGFVYIYDINALAARATQEVTWASDDAVLATDKVFNNVTINFSPMDEPELVKGEVEKDETFDSSQGALIYVDYHTNNYGACDSGEGFRLRTGANLLKSNIELGPDAQYFQIIPIYSGSDDTGVFWGRRSGNYGMSINPHAITVAGQSPRGAFHLNDDSSTCTAGMIMKLPRRLLNYTSIDRAKYALRINLQLLFDVRYNPFEGASEDNEEGNWEKLQDWTNQAYVPFRLILYDAGGIAISHYENKRMLQSNNYNNRSTYCKWVPGEGSWGDAFLAYYDWEDRKSASGCGGWQDNKPIIGYYRDALPALWSKRDAGDYIELPAVGGYLELQIGSGVHQFDYRREVKDIYPLIRWVMYKEPTITLCYKNGLEVESRDVEDMAFLNASAKENMSIETILGTPPSRLGLPVAKGLLLSPAYQALSQCSRAGVNDRLERLLIGTIYSQYASRKSVLSGTADLISDFAVLADRSTQGKFMLLGEVQDLAAGESEVTMVEIAADDYQGVDFTED